MITGDVRFFDKIYTFKSCKGIDGNCGKSIKPTDTFCPKVGCNKKVDHDDLQDDFNIRVIIFDDDGNCHSLTSFKKTLLSFMTSEGSHEDRLEALINKRVKAYINEGNDGNSDILESLTIVSNN